MPTLNRDPISSATIESLSEALSLATQEPLRQLARDVETINKRNLELFRESVRAAAIGQSLLISLKPMFEYQKSIAKIIAAAVSFKPFIMDIQRINMFPTYSKTQEIIEGEIEGQAENKTNTQIINRPALIPAQIPIPDQRAKMGLKEVPGGFKYKGRIIKKVSQKNAEGRLLSLLLKSSDCFAKEEEIYEKLHLNVGRSFSWVLRNLKNKLKKVNFLRIEIERRWDPDGYVIVGVNYIN
jgi:hypothetical protein